jgi:hypothetical protein
MVLVGDVRHIDVRRAYASMAATDDAEEASRTGGTVSDRVSPVRRLGSAAAVVAALATVVLSAAPAQAAGDGYVRLAHLSPDTPAVDVYLKSDSGTVKDQKFDGVAYGAMSDYLRLPTGTYSVAMRKAGAAASTPPVLTTQVTVVSGAAYTVAGVGRYADLGLRVLKDDLTVLSVPLSQLFVFALIAVVVGVLAAVIPAARASRLNVLEEISTE